MSVDYHRQKVRRHREKIAKLREKKSREVAKAAQEAKKGLDAAEAAGWTRSASTKQSRLRQAQRHEKRAADHQKKVAELERQAATEHRRLRDAERRLASAKKKEEQDRRREEERLERAHSKRMSEIASKLTHHTELHEVALAAIERLGSLPDEITVLFLAANPVDQAQLRLDEEVRSIGEMIRKSEYRDAVRLESRWAVRPLDVLQAINECSPAVVHFSGHGSDEELAFQDEQGRTKLVSKEAVAQTLAAASGTIQLVFFNLCYSRSQAEAVVEHVPCAIGMNTAIGDEGARVFAAQFYSAVGFGRSVAEAFNQAKAALLLEGISDEDTPEIFTTPGLDAEALILVDVPEA